MEATQRPSGSYRDNSALSDQTEATWILFPMYGCPKQKMVTQILLPKSMDMCRIFFDLVTIGLCGTQRQKITFRNKWEDIRALNHSPCDNWRTQRPRGAYRWRETPVAASWWKAQTDPLQSCPKWGKQDFEFWKEKNANITLTPAKCSRCDKIVQENQGFWDFGKISWLARILKKELSLQEKIPRDVLQNTFPLFCSPFP